MLRMVSATSAASPPCSTAFTSSSRLVSGVPLSARGHCFPDQGVEHRS